MTRLRLIPSPDPDRDLPDPGHEREECPACRDCGEPTDDPDSTLCDRCHWGPGNDDAYYATADEDHRAVWEHD